MSLGSKALALAAIGVVVLFTLACGRSGQAEATATPLPTPTQTPFDTEATLKRSGKVMQALGSFHFRLRHESGSIELLPGLLIDELEGDVINPDKLSISFTGVYGTGFAIKVSLISLGDDSYMTNPLTGQWEAVASNISPLGFFNPGQGIAAMMLGVEQARLLGDLGDKEGVYQLGGDLPAEALAPLLGRALKDTTVRVELTIDADAFYLLQARISGRVIPSDTDRVVRVITISNFDKPATIEAPL
jgi:hypothetical protein